MPHLPKHHGMEAGPLWLGWRNNSSGRGGEQMLFYIQTPRLQWLSLACPHHSSGIKPSEKGWQEAPKCSQAGRGRSAPHLQPKDPKASIQGSALPTTGTDPELPPQGALRSHDRWVQELLLGIRGWVFLAQLPPTPFFGQKQQCRSLCSLETSPSRSAFPGECLSSASLTPPCEPPTKG